MESCDRIPDTIILLIFNCVSDVKALTRCRAVSKRFNSLVPHTESLLLKVDCVQRCFERWNGRRLMWTASALIAASKRHYWVRDVVKKQRQLQNLVLRDKEGEGILVMDNEGLMEFRKAPTDPHIKTGVSIIRNRLEACQTVCVRDMGGWTRLPSVTLRTRMSLKLDLKRGGGGAWMAGATLLIAKPINSSSNDDGARQPPIEADAEEDEKHVELALEAFGGGVYAEAVRDLARCTHGYCHLNIPF